ncbi:MAG: AbrB/MazE/SpoVT family DNA-binding domain-containing protein [Armatimonadota bacterium]
MSEHADLTSHFMGAATVGERGQVVIPAEARERLDIKPGDKLLVFVHPARWGVAFVKFDKMQQAKLELEQALFTAEQMGAVEEAGPAPEEEEA